MDPDRVLAADAAAGSRDAFDELVLRHQARIYKLARILTGGDADAEDLVQETFVRAYRGIGRFRGESSFSTWLHRIAVNVIKSYLSRRSRQAPIVSPPLDDDRPETLIDRVASHEDLETVTLQRDAIDRALATLPEEQRLVVTLRDVQGLEYHEIATLIGLPIGTVESRVFRARQRLRPLLEPVIRRSSAGVP